MASHSLTLTEFRIELGLLHDTIGTVDGCTTSIEEDIAAVKEAFRLAELVWQSPSSASFGSLQREFSTNMDTLVTLLHEMKRRMKTAYDTYHEVEETNTRNFHKKH
ncbi:WXG100 family type VII secretion target [Streptomyces pinistramenti]|uniref:WXG100 family type VII secretion target n=1 Tax=Streptomyces pinistramenti TaxID=2884812 RepID=UPI001D083154|nr:WXG100 family type VII secretion target [Streptomyces pinistramenti]MCB5908058.1 WXG100 family type VII secretion target [Streptomyces pinistramenti]